MRIRLEVSGGVPGMQLPTIEVDCSELDALAAKRWQKLIEQANFFAIAQKNLDDKGCDLMQYIITVEDRSKLHQVTFDDLTMTNAIAEIVDRLQEE